MTSPAVPQHLRPIESTEYVGTVGFDAENETYWIRADPDVLEFAKRLFPGSRGRLDHVRFHATARSVEDLHWLMLRYPLRVLVPQRYQEDRERAVGLALRRLGAADLEPATDPPHLLGKLFPYQTEDVAAMVANERVLNANPNGLGKTVETLAAIAHAGAYPALLVVEPHVQTQWLEMIRAWLAPPVSGMLPGVTPPLSKLCHHVQGLTPYELPDTPLVLIHYGLLHAWPRPLQRRRFRALVLDEAQQVRHAGSKKYRTLHGLAQEVRYCWGLSATPIYGYGEEIFNVMDVLEYRCLGDRMGFSNEWCGGYGRAVTDPEKLGHYLRREGLMIRRTEAEVGSQLPDKRRIAVPIDHDENVFRRMVGEAAQLAARYQGMTFTERGLAARQIDTATRLAAGVSKAPAVAAFIRSLVESGEHVLVGAHHHQVHDAIVNALGEERVAKITGRETTREKERNKQRFIEGDAPVCLLALRAAAGVDGLQKTGTCVVFAELDWSPAVHSQFEGRIRRYGVEHQGALPCYYLVAENSYDSVVRAALGLKTGQFLGLVGEEGESEEDRTLAEETVRRHLESVIDNLRRLHEKRQIN